MRPATGDMIREWFNYARSIKEEHFTHMIIGCDVTSEDLCCYPRYAVSVDHAHEIIDEIVGDHEIVREVYNLDMDLEMQMLQATAYNLQEGLQ